MTDIDTDGLLAAVADDTATARELLDDAAARLGKYSETVPVSNYAQAAAAIATGYAQLANIGVQVASNAGAAEQQERIFQLQSVVADAHRAMADRQRAEQAEIELRTEKLAQLNPYAATSAAAKQREERAVAEARPHDDEPDRWAHLRDTCPHGIVRGLMTCPRCEPEKQAAAEASARMAADLHADRHAEITEAERSEEVHGG